MTVVRARSLAPAVAASALPAFTQQPPHHPDGAANPPSSMPRTSKADMGGMKGDAATRMQMMEERMDMMQSMMLMMMERTPAAPPK